MLNYKGLKGVYERLIVSDAQVDRQVDALLDQHTRAIPVTERPSEPGDELILDYTGYCDGVPFEGGAGQNQSLVLGSGQFIPGFEEQLVGKRAGDETQVRVTFPTPYHAEALAGKDAVFKCVVKAVRQRQRFAPNDDFARELGFDRFTDLRQALRQGLQAYADRQADEDLKLKLLDQLAAEWKGEIARDQLDSALDAEMDALKAQLARQGLTLDAYCHFTGKTQDQLRQESLPDARKRVIRQQIISEIIRAEGLEATEADVAGAIRQICRENNLTPEQLSASLDENAQRAVVSNVLTQKALDCLRDSAIVETVERTE